MKIADCVKKNIPLPTLINLNWCKTYYYRTRLIISRQWAKTEICSAQDNDKIKTKIVPKLFLTHISFHWTTPLSIFCFLLHKMSLCSLVSTVQYTSVAEILLISPHSWKVAPGRLPLKVQQHFINIIRLAKWFLRCKLVELLGEFSGSKYFQY
jgi:hypothetical protein